MANLQTLLGGRAFLEGPRWHDGALYVSDMHAHEVLRVATDGAVDVLARLDAAPSGLGWLPDGSMLIVSMDDRRILRRGDDGSLTQHADLSERASHAINDMVVDGAGHAFVSQFGCDLFGGEVPKPAPLLRVDPDGSAHEVTDGLRFANGMVVTADGRTLVVAESAGRCLTAFSLAPDGALSDRRLWADLPETDYPDGICIDVEAAIWSRARHPTDSCGCGWAARSPTSSRHVVATPSRARSAAMTVPLCSVARQRLWANLTNHAPRVAPRSRRSWCRWRRERSYFVKSSGTLNAFRVAASASYWLARVTNSMSCRRSRWPDNCSHVGGDRGRESMSSSVAVSNARSRSDNPCASGPSKILSWVSASMPRRLAMRRCCCSSYSQPRRCPTRRITSSVSRRGSLPKPSSTPPNGSHAWNSRL